MEDCESSLTMRVRCRRWQLLVLIPLLAIASLVTNISLLMEHVNEQMATTTTTPIQYKEYDDMPLNQILWEAGRSCDTKEATKEQKGGQKGQEREKEGSDSGGT
jgi:hypothetical protein